MDPPFPKIKSKKEGGSISLAVQFKYPIQLLQLFQTLLILIRNILRPTGRYLPCVRRYGVAIAVAPNGQSPREGKGNTSETVFGFLEYIHPAGKAADSRFGVLQIMYACVELQSICKYFCLNIRKASFEKLINKSLHTLQ